jgi:hypothetical protein
MLPELLMPLKLKHIQPCTQTWIEEMAEMFALMGAFLNITHPKMYKAGQDTLKLLLSNPAMVKEGDTIFDIFCIGLHNLLDMGSSATVLHHYTRIITHKVLGLICLPWWESINLGIH